MIESLAGEVTLLKRSLFGNRRERFDDPNSGALFEGQWIDSDPDQGEQVADNADATETELVSAAWATI